ncbi:TorF family putative porin [Aurantiacibacter rhizosphaerae]|uniref:Porin n=1 Tax=Aurantiacibacter rhizosphaerae TaxID=2691582 RepID=A0A844XCB1_9SPHN|nr:TorF family putative porin [Aurantiacibacter rhizosphaerae]MWV27274.1 hypothetical protein [Aurantiacibacter rhizosphaerae]
MLTSVRSLTAASVFALSAAFAAPAMAQDDDGGIGVEVSANVAMVSEYRFRGVDLSGGEFAIQGGVDVGLPAGFYVGTWASSLDEQTVGYGSTELDLYGGWAGEFGNISTDVGVIMYIYPDAGPGDFDYVEFYGSVGAAVGPAEVTVGIAYAPDQDSLGSTDNFYIYSDVGVGVPGTPISLTGHVGYTDGFLTFTTDGEAFDYSVGAEVAIAGTPLAVGVSYVGVEGDGIIDPGGTFTSDGVVVTLGASF